MTDGKGQRSVERVRLDKMTKSELWDLRKRQDGMLANQKFVDRLPDKGAKLRKLKSDIDAAIRKLDSMSFTDKRWCQSVEWSSITNSTKNQVTQDDDDDDDDDDVLKTLASNGHPEKILIQADLSSGEMPSGSKPQPNPSLEDPFVDDLTRKLEEKLRLVPPERERSYFNKSVTGNPQNFEKHRAKYFVEGVWIETGVTPPIAKFTEAKEIPFKESYRLQKEQAEKQSEIQSLQAAMQIAVRLNLSHSSSNTGSSSSIVDDDCSAGSQDATASVTYSKPVQIEEIDLDSIRFE